MIAIDEQSPRWLRELGRFIGLKNLLFLYGNIYDLVSYPIRKDGTAECMWTESLPRDFLERFLLGLGYEVIGFADPVEDLRFVTPQMETMFKQLQSAPAVLAPSVPAIEVARAASPPASSPEPRLRPPSSVNGVDWNRVVDDISRAVENAQVPCAFVINLASRFISSPDDLGPNERVLFTKFLKASLAGREVVRADGRRWNNLVILICDKLNDIPAFLYLNNPRARSVPLELPDREDRRRFIRRRYRGFHGVNGSELEPPENIISDFVDLTDGLTNFELSSLVNLSRRENVSVVDPDSGSPNIRRIIEMYKYGVTVSSWDRIDDKLRQAEDTIRAAIKGQDEAVTRVLEIISRAKFGLAAGESHKSNRPRGVLFFAGPTGVGKTEMAKALAASLFGEAERLIRFDMSEYGAEHSDQRLLGAPPGYTGYDEGGQLTDTVKKHPFSILLFDEIEKAHPKIFDKFLQILDDGRLTDGKGETVYFSECLIIFTSNLGIVGEGGDPINEKTPPAEMKETVLGRIREHFNVVLRRPEILNRFGDNFVVFDFIRPPVDEQIVMLLLQKLVRAAREKKRLELVIEPNVTKTLVTLARRNLHHGGRGIRNVIDSALINPLSHKLFEQDVKPPARVVVRELIEDSGAGGRRYEIKIECAAK